MGDDDAFAPSPSQQAIDSGWSDGERISEELAQWWDFGVGLGFSGVALYGLDRRARLNGTSLPEEIVASGKVDEAAVYRAFAAGMGLGWRDEVDSTRLQVGASEAVARLRGQETSMSLPYRDDEGRQVHVISPEPGEWPALLKMAAGWSLFGQQLFVVPRAAMRSALMTIAAPLLTSKARDTLFLETPQLSGRLVTNAWQGAALGAFLVGFPSALAVRPVLTMLTMHSVLSAFFIACASMRIAAFLSPRRKPVAAPVPPQGEVPFYTVLIALRDEAEVVPELLASIGRLVWPRSRLEVKLICEAEDRVTIDAIRAHNRFAWLEVVEVPGGMPKTKPNALDYALPATRGEFVVLYDAEDRPDRYQLVEAWRRFRAEDETLACLQAPIDIDNTDAGLLPRMFGFEYAGLFHGLLPFIGQAGVVMPLGGTSNHFRRSALEKVGAWDPYNVTEDADLGVRLARYGYRTDVLWLPTGEDAPETFGIWLKQRTRWMKGWMQTWLVHMRSPFRLLAELGPFSFVAFQLLVAGMVVSSLGHPFLIVGAFVLAFELATSGDIGAARAALAIVDVSSILLAYAGFLALGWITTPSRGRRGFWRIVLFMPLYWMMLSLASWRAAIQLFREPHRWEKTPHRPHRRAASPPLSG